MSQFKTTKILWSLSIQEIPQNITYAFFLVSFLQIFSLVPNILNTNIFFSDRCLNLMDKTKKDLK